MKNFQPLFPELHKPNLVCYNVEMQWGIRKYEIKTMILRFVRQREAAYKAYNNLTVERIHQLAVIKSSLKACTTLYSEKYIASVLKIIGQCLLVMPYDDICKKVWQSRFDLITAYCDSFLKNFELTKTL